MTVLAIAVGAPAAAEGVLRDYRVDGDAIERPLTGRPGDAARGEALVADRRRSLCLLCHTGPFPQPHAQGTLAPDLRGVGARLSEGQLRLRVVDMRRLAPSSIMPSYYRVDGLTRVGRAWQGRPVLTAEEIEDIVAFLMTLKE
ncbi:sulfur oxidation c-type cytochrome SoxX [Pelagibius sp. 7325]|uniref:sulfur oxidation c-type cytochrome SoxX n=1 Tax=Pelagibius sp. 7325 TaxID=3131994 RepID=UPI0030EE066F